MKRSVWLPLLGAVTWAALLLPGAIYLPIGTQEPTASNPHLTSTGKVSLVHINGHGILIVVTIPLVLSLLAGISLVLQARTDRQLFLWAAWVLTGAVLAGAVLGTVTFLIGIFVIPVGVLLAVASANVHHPHEPLAASPSVPEGHAARRPVRRGPPSDTGVHQRPLV